MIRPRGWHLDEAHVLVDGAPISRQPVRLRARLLPQRARAAGDAGPGPYFYLPKLESHLEARLWNDVFVAAQERAGHAAAASIRATVLIETILAAFEMEEILYELREHAAGLNAGPLGLHLQPDQEVRARRPDMVLPDRAQVTMAVPFMRAYTAAAGGDLPSPRGARHRRHERRSSRTRREPEVTERALATVREDKEREAGDGFDGTWVAHPDLVPVAGEVFDAVLGERPNQKDRLRPEVRVTAADLLDVAIAGRRVTEAGRADQRLGRRCSTSPRGSPATARRRSTT